MKFSKNSLTARLYCWYYNLDDWKLPKNLCPFFWKTVYMYLTLLPLLVIAWPAILFIEQPWSEENGDEMENSQRIGGGFFLYVVGFLALTAIAAPFRFFMTFKEGGFFDESTRVGAFIWVVAIGISLYFLIKGIVNYIKEKRQNRLYEKLKNAGWPDDLITEPKKNLLIEFIKAKYNKYCPQIEWESNKES